MANSIQKSGLTVAVLSKSQGERAFELSARSVQFFKTYTGKIFENLGEF